MPLSWNEIRHNAIRFANAWAGARSESAEKQTFWNEFFEAFGLKRRLVATFEEPVKNIRGQYSFIDLFWPGVVLVEHKSFGKDLHKAETQAYQYIRDLANDPARRDEIPRAFKNADPKRDGKTLNCDIMSGFGLSKNALGSKLDRYRYMLLNNSRINVKRTIF